MPRARPLVLLALAAVLALAVAACGGSDDEASSSTSVDQLLRQTFSGDREVASGRLDLSLKIEGSGGEAAGMGGPVTVRLFGPFTSEGDGRLPRFALDAELQGGGQRITAGVTSTGDEGFVSFQGRDYEVSDQVFRAFRAGYEEAQKRGGSGQSFASLGMDPRRWLKDARTAGEATVGDAETIKITGGVDVAALLDDVDRALAKARELGLENADKLPTRLSPEQRRRAEQAVEDVRVEIYTGKEDSILRRLRLDLRIADRDAGSGALALDLTLTGVNDDQEISAPSDPRPFAELADQLRTLGLALGLGGSGGSGSGSEGSGSGGANLDEYADCITEAGADADAARKCADLLAP
jgi:hypothetical protein